MGTNIATRGEAPHAPKLVSTFAVDGIPFNRRIVSKLGADALLFIRSLPANRVDLCLKSFRDFLTGSAPPVDFSQVDNSHHSFCQD